MDHIRDTSSTVRTLVTLPANDDDAKTFLPTTTVTSYTSLQSLVVDDANCGRHEDTNDRNSVQYSYYYFCFN
jgi:hypothetical protein